MDRLVCAARHVAIFTSILVILTDTVSAADKTTFNDTARFLAGLQPSSASPLIKYTNETSWQRHAKNFESAWQELDGRQLSKIRTWSKQNLTTPQSTMLYMFSGPDFLYADSFFPNASKYVLSGLEPVGNLPDVTKLSRNSRAVSLARLRASLQTVMNFSFFITKKMKEDLIVGKLRGTLPILFTFLARTGKTIQNVDFVTIDKSGALKESGSKRAKRSAPGVRIKFSSGDGQQRTLYYFSTDLSNGGVRRTGFLKFCKQLGSADSLVKSASYLMHSGGFSTVRAFLLDQSTTIVQDDSGIPVRYFSPSRWQLQPFGKYIRPISIFEEKYQSEMRRLFTKSRSRPVDFGIGYRWRPRETNILLAVKKNTHSSND